MPEVICDTSPLQYLHQIGQLRLLPALARRMVVPSAVVEEIATGRVRGVDFRGRIEGCPPSTDLMCKAVRWINHEQ